MSSIVKKKDLYEMSLDYHSQGRPGKLEVVATKPCQTQLDLSLAYSPGVAQPCIEISKDESKVGTYTGRSNLVAVISNGTAVLGLGKLGPKAAKPVMEGKAILFKRFADIDVFDIEIDTEDPDEFIRCVKLLEPTFGGINLEDIKAPECFQIETELKQKMGIPVFHDDQHGTAIISGAALVNAIELVKKDISKVQIVFCGSGASAIACGNMYVSLGAKRENIIYCDEHGVIYRGRTNSMNPYKEEIANKTKHRTLAEAVKGADVLVGLSVGGAISKDMVKSMGDNPIVFAMANPYPEITYEDAVSVRSDIIMATGRSDYPNQVNNVLGFPFIFRGALDVEATAINEEMKIAAAKSLAALAREDVSDQVSKAYEGELFQFGREYIIPKPFDSRALLWVAPAVAQAAMKSGVAKKEINLEEYQASLEKRLGVKQSFFRNIKDKISDTITQLKNEKQQQRKFILPKIVFPEGENHKILRAAEAILEEGFAEPILLGYEKRILERVEDLGLRRLQNQLYSINPQTSQNRVSYAETLWDLRHRKGMTRDQAKSLILQNNYYASVMVYQDDAQGMVTGLTQTYANAIRPFIHVVGTRKEMKISGVYTMLFKDRLFFFSDTTVNIDPSAEDLVDIAIGAAEQARFFGYEPRVALLSFSNFGSNDHPNALKVKKATQILKSRYPGLMVDGEMHADTAVVPGIIEETFPFSTLKGGANVLIFPDLQSANISYKLLQRVGGAEAVGPILVGMNKPLSVVQRSSDVDEIVNMAMITVMEIQQVKRFKSTFPSSFEKSPPYQS